MLARFRSKLTDILDIACGEGTVAVAMAKRGFKVTGVDQSAEMQTRSGVAPTSNSLMIFVMLSRNLFCFRFFQRGPSSHRSKMAVRFPIALSMPSSNCFRALSLSINLPRYE